MGPEHPSFLGKILRNPLYFDRKVRVLDALVFRIHTNEHQKAMYDLVE